MITNRFLKQDRKIKDLANKLLELLEKKNDLAEKIDFLIPIFPDNRNLIFLLIHSFRHVIVVSSYLFASNTAFCLDKLSGIYISSYKIVLSK